MPQCRSGKDSSQFVLVTVVAVLIYCLGLTFITVLFSPYYYSTSRSSPKEASGQEYRDVADIAKQCPPVKPLIDSALADDKLSQSEVDAIAKAFQAASDADAEAGDMDDGRSRLGLKPYANAPRCDRYDEAGLEPLEYRMSRY